MISNIKSDWLAMRNISSLKAEREKLGLSQTMLAQQIGVSPAYISAAETGKHTCSVIAYNALASIFNWDKFFPCRTMPALDNDNQRELTLGFEQANSSNLAQEDPDACTHLKGVKVTSYISELELKRIRIFAAFHNSNVSSVIREAIQLFLRSNQDVGLQHDYNP